ncbi:YopN chaperone SycN-like protein [Hahella sp. CCB-MM4]|uniref:YopN chaperone SycN-like protein n=1 Tax=Hahella sp. (strain CCB-MM4) TaxID=1926491 RepID=UPI000B9A24CE|nr:YopN chaperone SycN-like protein [Hahella sp. CCB-MM4]OZG74326.1 YopN chaperone SycN-like protein [Hahella sp. CCB-MM4]
MIQAPAIGHTLNEFLYQIGFTDFTWHGAPLTLSFEHSGSLHMEMTDRGLLIAQLREINEYDSANIIAKALRLVHYDKPLPLVVQTGIKSHNQLAFITTLSPQQLSIPGLTEAVGLLEYLHHKVTQ